MCVSVYGNVGSIPALCLASAERLWWEAKGNGAYLKGKWILKNGASDYDDMANRKVNSCRGSSSIGTENPVKDLGLFLYAR